MDKVKEAETLMERFVEAISVAAGLYSEDEFADEYPDAGKSYQTTCETWDDAVTRSFFGASDEEVAELILSVSGDAENFIQTVESL